MARPSVTMLPTVLRQSTRGCFVHPRFHLVVPVLVGDAVPELLGLGQGHVQVLSD